jgi:two-component system, OmpR family, alkaline phosphatase synthesis response regulator PhoP
MSMPYSILSVDDEPDVTALVRFHFSKAGFEVLTAASGREAIETIRCRHPDLVLVDLMLPDIDGLGLCEIIRQNSATAAIPIVILTAWATAEARQAGRDLGAIDYVTKPFSPRDLVDRVARLLGQRPVPA